MSLIQSRAFHATAPQGILSAAARQLRLTLSRQISALEGQLRVTLFPRVGRRLALTEAGAALLADMGAMAEAARGFALAAADQSAVTPTGVTLSVTKGCAAYVMPDLMVRLRARLPELRLTLVATDRLSDLQRREADLALGHRAPDASGLIGDRLADQSAGFYPAPEWIAAHGAPQSLSDLEVSELVGMRDPAQFLHFMRVHGTPLGDGVPMLASDNAVAVWDTARRGLGVALMLDDIARRFPEMQRILPDLRPITVPLWLVAYRALYDSARLRRLRAALIAEIA
ncbi:MAG: LysR family transcriptional regulator [Rhodobacteraceae bacterium]|nr:MAG: LysR family transcriptional regulator [Paracoccaceae bacterium]